MNRLGAIVVFSLGFVGGIIYLASCGSAGANVTSQKIIRVQGTEGTDTATCPAGTFVMGGGCVDNGNCNTPQIKYSHPSPTSGASTAWKCAVACDPDGTGSVSNLPFAMCAQATPSDALTAE
jgi:hypothetical protein